MRLVVIAVGRLKKGPERDLAARFEDRIAKAGRAIGCRPVEIVEIDESRAREAADRVKQECKIILGALPARAATIVFDERGEAWSSDAFAKRLGRFRDEGREALAFVIGGPDGVAEAMRQRADSVVSFGKMTFPHQLVRIMLLEQLYRAITILSGHPYHRA